MNLAICIDNNFIMQACTLVASLRVTNKDLQLKLFVFSEKLSESSKEVLIKLVHNTQISINFITIDLHMLPNLPLTGKEHLSLATYYRILVPLLIPESIQKILYMDCDMIVLDSLQALWETNLSDKCAGTVIDMFNDDIEISKRLNYDPRHGYFNAGMILMNIPVWKRNKISEQALEFLINYPEKCLAHDQDALNHALNGSLVNVSARYNMQLDFFCPFSNLIVDKKFYDDIDQSRKNPVIIHFTGPSKPWLSNCTHPYTNLWDFFQHKTEFRDLKKKCEYKGTKKIKYHIRTYLTKFHILKPNPNFLRETYVTSNDILNKLKEQDNLK